MRQMPKAFASSLFMDMLPVLEDIEFKPQTSVVPETVLVVKLVFPVPWQGPLPHH